MKKNIVYLLLFFNSLLADTCLKMVDMVDDTKYARLEINYCEHWTNIQIQEIDSSAFGNHPYINILERKKLDNLIYALEKSLSLYEKMETNHLSIKKSFNIFSENLQFIDVYFDSTKDIIEVKIEITSSNNINFFIISDKVKLIELIKKIKDTQSNGYKKLEEIKKY